MSLLPLAGFFVFTPMSEQSSQSPPAAVADTPVDDMSWAFEDDSTPEPPTTTDADAATPGADSQEQGAEDQADDALIEQQAAPEEKAEAKPEDKGAADQKTASDTAKEKRVFEDHFLNPAKPPEEIIQYLESRSPSRYADLEGAMLRKRLSDPAQLAKRIAEMDGEAYGALMLEAYEKDGSEFYARAMTGRDDMTKELVKEAVSFWEANKGKEMPAATGITPLTAEQVEEITKLFDDEPEVLAFIEAAQKAASAKPSEAKPEQSNTATGEAQKPEAAKPDADKSKEQPANTVPLEVRQEAFTAFESGVESYFTSKLEEEFGLAVTDKERELAPEVADLKEEKMSLFLRGGRAGLSELEVDFANWAKGLEKTDEAGYQAIKAAVDSALFYVDKGEKANVLEAIKSIFPYADKYARERLKHPAFQRLDARLTQAAKNTNPKQPKDPIIPGAPRRDSQQGVANSEQALTEDLLSDAGLR